MITDYEILKYYFDKSKKYDKNIPRNTKMAGNIFAMSIRKYIKKILEGTNYKVSINNSFVEGIKNEWDLIIAKKGASDNGVNIYNQDDVRCVIELKTATYFKGDWKIVDNEKENEDNYKNDIEKRFKGKDGIDDNIEPIRNHCRYLYVSLFQNPNHRVNEILSKGINSMKANNGNNSTFFFWVSNSYDEDEIKEKKREEQKEKFKEFILDSLK